MNGHHYVAKITQPENALSEEVCQNFWSVLSMFKMFYLLFMHLVKLIELQ